MDEWMSKAFNCLRGDLAELFANHARGCPQCDRRGAPACSYARGIEASYRRVEERLAPTPLQFP